MKKKLFFVVGNHLSIIGIKSYFSILKEIYPNHQIIKTNKIKKNSINILIENFKKKSVDEIIRFKKKYNSKIILILTEFINKEAHTYNSFELKNKIHRYIPYHIFSTLNLAIIISLVYTLILIFFLEIKISNFYLLIAILTYLLGPTVYYQFKQILKKILIKYTSFNLTKYRQVKKKYLSQKRNKDNFFNVGKLNFYTKLVNLKYFKNRYIQANRILYIADLILVSHPSIYKDLGNINKKVYYVFPEIKKIKFNKIKNPSRIFKFSGELTSYRYFYFQELDKTFSQLDYNIKNSYKIFINKLKLKGNRFIDIDSSYKYKFSFHPKKNNDWKYSSPIRYIEAIKKGEIPIIFDHFKDFVSTNLAISLKNNSKKKTADVFKNYNRSLNKVIKGIKKYNYFLKKNKRYILNETYKLEKKIV